MDSKHLIDIEASHNFKDGKFIVSMSIESDVLKVQVEDESNGDEWIGKFSANYIEQLTHKTGNFKEFSIFCSMLESGLNKTSESIMLELMAYSDLESLRNQKSGINQKKMVNGKLQSKRYLIMTYTVEFDRIHYPLSLNYIGKADVPSLKKVIRQQNIEINSLRSKIQSALESSNGHNVNDSSFHRLLEENEALTSELEECKRTLSNHDVAKELRILKKVIQSLENDLLKEKNRNQRIVQRKADENRRLAEELEDVRSSERNLRLRVKSLTEEISILKRSSQISPSVHYSTRWIKKVEKPPLKGRRRSTSIERKYITPSPSGSKRFDPTAYIEEKKRKQKETDESKRRSRSSSSRIMCRSRSSSFDRFIPLHSPQTKIRQSSSKQRPSSAKARNVRHRRNSSVSSIGSRQSSTESGYEMRLSNLPGKSANNSARGSSSYSISRKESKRSTIKKMPPSGDSDLEVARARRNRKSTLTENKKKRTFRGTSADKETFINRETDEKMEIDDSLDIAEIDARLSALQKFMKSNMDDV